MPDTKIKSFFDEMYEPLMMKKENEESLKAQLRAIIDLSAYEGDTS